MNVVSNKMESTLKVQNELSRYIRGINWVGKEFLKYPYNSEYLRGNVVIVLTNIYTKIGIFEHFKNYWEMRKARRGAL